MNPLLRVTLQIVVLAIAIGLLIFLFPRASEFVEMGARELRYFWWLVLIVVLGVWLIFGLGRKKK